MNLQFSKGLRRKELIFIAVAAEIFELLLQLELIVVELLLRPEYLAVTSPCVGELGHAVCSGLRVKFHCSDYVRISKNSEIGSRYSDT